MHTIHYTAQQITTLKSMPKFGLSTPITKGQTFLLVNYQKHTLTSLHRNLKNPKPHQDKTTRHKQITKNHKNLEMLRLLVRSSLKNPQLNPKPIIPIS